jgi:hypothetical protein
MSGASLQPFAGQLAAWLAQAAPLLVMAVLVVLVMLMIMQWRMHRRLTRLALGRNGSIEETIAILSRDMKEFKEFRVELEKYLKLAESRLRGAITGVGVVRFNPFEGSGQGGNQSSSVAFVDERGMGVVFSTLYSRDRVAVYAKPVENGSSPYELTQEEQAALKKALHHIAEHKKRA